MAQEREHPMRKSEQRSRSHQIARSPRGETRGWQIGPRIRVGGTLGKIGQDIKIGAGKIASNPITQGVAGAFLGPAAAAGIAGLGKVLDTSKGGLHGAGGVLDLAKAGALGYGAGKVGQVVKGIGGQIAKGGIGSIFSGGGADGKGNLGAIGDLAGKIGGGGLGGVLGLDGLGGSIGDFLGNGRGGLDLGKIGLLGLGGLQMKNAADLQKQSTGYATDALKGVQENYNSRAPLRAAGQGGMLNPQIMDLSHLLDHSGPYAKGILPGLGKAPGTNVAPVQKFT